MSSDDSKTPPDVTWRPTGVGMSVLFRCDKCNQPRSPGGSVWKKLGGTRQHWCRYCAEKK